MSKTSTIYFRLLIYCEIFCIHVYYSNIKASCLKAIKIVTSEHLNIITLLIFHLLVVTESVCPYLVDPANGRVCLTGNSTAVTATYSCNTDFELVGDDILMCGDDGQWSENPSLCRRT